MSTKPEKTVRVAELKAKLSAYLRAARRGHAVTVCDRDTPVARLVPYAAEGGLLDVRKATASLRDIVLPAAIDRSVDSLAVLLSDRERSR